MKSIRPTTAKTRKGVIAWLAKYNDKLKSLLNNIYENDNIVAVHVHRVTGQLVAYEYASGELVRTDFKTIYVYHGKVAA